jgi:hypothetical protein
MRAFEVNSDSVYGVRPRRASIGEVRVVCSCPLRRLSPCSFVMVGTTAKHRAYPQMPLPCGGYSRATMLAVLDISGIAFQQQSYAAGCSDCAFWGHLELTRADSGYDYSRIVWKSVKAIALSHLGHLWLSGRRPAGAYGLARNLSL